VNDETSRLLGYTREELIHMNIFDIDAHITVEGWADDFNSMKETKQAIFESMLKGKGGALIPVEVCANYIELYGNEYYCVAARDITERKKMEEALLNAEDFQRSILDSLQSHIAVIDGSGVIVYVNEAWKRFGSENGACTEESVGVGINYFDVCRMASGDHSSEAPIALKGMIAVMNGESDVFELEYPCHSPDTNRWFHMKITPFVGRKKRGIVVHHNEITTRKLIEEDLKKSEANLVKAQRITHLGNWSWLIGIDEVKCSDEYYRIFGIEKQKSITYGQFISTVHPLDREFVNSAVNAALSNGKPYSIDYRVIWPDGSEHIIHAEGELNVDKANKPVLLFGVVQDITEQKLIEREMQKAKAMVEMYNDLLGHDINNMNQVGIGYLELALSSQGLSDETKELLSKPLEALINSSKLIENVKKLQRIKSGEVRHNKMDVNLVLLDVKKAISSINDRGIVIDYSPVPGCMVMANELLKDVFSNLVGNAIKHSKGPLEISMGISRVSADGKEHYRVYIEDNGPGIPDSIKNKLFTRFQRGDTQASGKGLGLYLVRTLVEDFDGRVWVEDRVPGDHAKGSRFVVMLPALT
jgi:PAS domain S-box-containing protein